ncbi:MAG: hypothetical protein ABFE01_26315 [Phycisphaerales bacterium]
MLSLIRREISDNLGYVVGAGIVVALAVWLSVYAVLWEQEPDMVGVSTAFLVPALLLGYYGLGASQMYGDRAHKVSTLLCTLAVTRNRILAARVLVGAGTVLATIVPLAVTAMVLLSASPLLAAYRGRIVGEIAATSVLAGFACYCMGLLVGWTTSKVWLLVGGITLLTLTVSLVVVKGFGLEAMGVLLLLIVASLPVVWYRFVSTPL